jgi:Holliday junction resolvase-like predicted endonuclease
MAEHNVTGKKGEEIAAAYLEQNGYTVLETNGASKIWRQTSLQKLEKL